MSPLRWWNRTRRISVAREIQEANYDLIYDLDPLLPTAVKLAKWSYKPYSPFPDGLQGQDYRIDIESIDADAVLLVCKEMVWLTFPGTASWRDAKTDFRFFRVPVYEDVEGGKSKKPYRVHEGFWDSAMTLAGTINKRLSGLRAADLPRFYVGHSLGGANALILAKRAVRQGHPHPVRLLTCGAPPVGDDQGFDVETATMEQDGDLNYWRVVNRGDGVVDILEQDEGGQLVFAGRDSKAHLNPAWEFYRAERRFIRGYDLLRFRFSRVRDHGMRNYLQLFGL